MDPQVRPYLRLGAAALGVAAIALSLYGATLLPGMDLGDSASFQEAGGSIEASPRQAYPLYFAFGNVVVWLAGGEPAYGMNLASAICGAAACGLVAWLIGMLTGSAIAAGFGGLLWTSSYTFWSQSIIAEVYALHILLLTASLIALVWWSWRPTSLGRLTLFFAVYALGFGNHLMMILLAPAAVLFVALMSPAGYRLFVRPRVIALAALMALCGAMQYAWNFSFLWALPHPPASVADALHIFWFDVTKADWRETLVFGIDESRITSRFEMYRFDLRQQIGIGGVIAALLGSVAGAVADWRATAAGLVGYVVALAFAVTYNVGDSHVFFLPSHLFLVLAAGCGAAAVLHRLEAAKVRASWMAAAAAMLVWTSWRIVDTYPAVDRSEDRRPLELMQQLAGDLPPERTILLAQLNWQLQNGLDYYARHVRPELLVVRPGSRMLTVPMLIQENRRHGRDVVLTRTSRRLIEAAYGDLFSIEPDSLAPRTTLAERLEGLRKGTPYVLAVLKPYAELPLDQEELDGAYALLTGNASARLRVDNVYMIVAGRVGAPPELMRSAARRFRTSTRIAGLRVDVRMESWLPADTMRRAGFGHVIVGRRHALTLERGVSVVALGADGRPLLTTYASSLFAPEPRFRIRAIPGA